MPSLDGLHKEDGMEIVTDVRALTSQPFECEDLQALCLTPVISIGLEIKKGFSRGYAIFYISMRRFTVCSKRHQRFLIMLFDH